MVRCCVPHTHLTRGRRSLQIPTKLRTPSRFFALYVSTDNFITRSGVVAYSFNLGEIFTDTWDENSDFNILFHPGASLQRKNFAQLIAAASTFTFAFNEFNGPAHAMIFRVTGLDALLPSLLAACPINFLAPPTESAQQEVLDAFGPSAAAPSPQLLSEQQLRQQVGPQPSTAPDLSTITVPTESREAVRRD